MESEEKRDIDGNTFELEVDHSDQDCQTGETFQNVVHVHCPSIYFTNQSRNVSTPDVETETDISSHISTGILTEIESERSIILPTSKSTVSEEVRSADAKDRL